MKIEYSDTGIRFEPTSEMEWEIVYRKIALDRVKWLALGMNPWAFLEFGYSHFKGDEKRARTVRHLKSIEEEHGIRFGLQNVKPYRCKL